MSRDSGACSKTRRDGQQRRPTACFPSPARASRRSCAACHTERCTSTRARWPANASWMFLENAQHQVQSGCVGRDLEAFPGGENEFQWRRCRAHALLRGFHECETHWLVVGRAQLSPPHVEGVLLQSVFAAERADALAALFLLGDSLAPPLTPFGLFGSAHFSTMRRNGSAR